MFQSTQAATFEPFLMLPRNDKFLRGQARYPAIASRSQFLLIGVFVLIGGVFLGFAIRDLISDLRLQQAGQTAQGMVISRRISGSKNPSYYISYRFPDQSTSSYYIREQQVSRDSYNRHPEKTSVSVAYLRDDPTASRLTGPDTDTSSRDGLLFFGLLWTGLTGVVLFFMLRSVMQDRWLAQHGEIIEGQLVNCSGRMTGGKGSYYKLSVDYQFCTPDGRIMFGKQNASRNDLRRTVLPATNTPVAVLYVDEKHYKLL
jgi:hypothetical protein